MSRETAESATKNAESRYRVLLPIDINEQSALGQARYVASLPSAVDTVVVTLTHVLHGKDLSAPRQLRSAQRVSAVRRTDEWLADNGISTEIRDVDDPYPPSTGIIGLADKIDADAIVLSGRKRSAIGTALFGGVVQTTIKNTSRPVVIVEPTR